MCSSDIKLQFYRHREGVTVNGVIMLLYALFSMSYFSISTLTKLYLHQDLTLNHFWSRYWETVGLFAFGIVLDACLLDSFWINLCTLHQKGVKTSQFLSHLTVNVLLGPLSLALHAYHAQEMEWRSLQEWTLWGRVLLCMAIGDTYFVQLHRSLHRHLPSLHILHHCCISPSYSSSFTFEVFDFVMEFVGPILLGYLVLMTPIFNQYDPLAWVVYIGVLVPSYALSHDRTMKLAHYKHHTVITSQYAIYMQHDVPRDDQDQVRGMLRMKTGEQKMTQKKLA